MNEDELLDKAKRRYAGASSPLRDERQQVLDDIRFCYIAGAQWEGRIGAQFENKLKLEVNKVMQAQTRINNEYLQNDISISFLPKKGTTDEQADFIAGLFRADQMDCNASEAYDPSYIESSCGGYGAFRLRSCYEDEYNEESDEQRIIWEPIPDAAKSVYFDPSAKRQDKSDAKYGFVVTSMDREEYKETYDDDPATWPESLRTYGLDWVTKDLVRIAEYYEVEDKKEKCYWLMDITGEEEKKLSADDFEDQGDELLSLGWSIKKEKKVKVKRIHKYILSGGKILEDCDIIAGKNIPIVEVFGKRVVIDSVERTMGHVRFAKDAQRLKNMQLSMLGETAVLSPREKPIFTQEQVAGHETTWSTDNLKNYPYSLVNTIQDAEGNEVAMGPLGYTKPPMVPPATAALLQITEQDMADILGRGDAGEDLVSGVSGKAVELIQNRLDGVAYTYLDNFAKAKKRGAEIWLSMAKELYVDEGRLMKTVDQSGASSEKMLMESYVGKNGEILSYDPSEVNVDVVYEIGPDSESKRAATSRNILGAMQVSSDEKTLRTLSALLLFNIEGEGMIDVRESARKDLVAMGVMKPTEEDLAEMEAQGQQPDPQAEYMSALAQRELAEAESAKADIAETMANAELKQAQKIETLAGIEQENKKLNLEVAKAVDKAASEAPVRPVIMAPIPPQANEFI